MICPVNKSPMKDFGYDVSDFTAIDPIYGTMDDFTALVKGLHDRGDLSNPEITGRLLFCFKLVGYVM